MVTENVPFVSVITKSQYVSMSTSSKTKENEKSKAADSKGETKGAVTKVEQEPSEIDLYR